MRSFSSRTIVYAALASLVGTAAASTAAASHRPIVYAGQLLAENGLPYTGTVSVSVQAWDSAAAGNEIWSQAAMDVDVMGGVANIQLGVDDPAALAAILAGADEVWLSFTVDDELLSPRQQLTSVPYAAVAGNANMLQGMDAAAFVKTGDSVPASSLPTDSIGQASNGAITNSFQSVTVTWNGSPQNILDAEPINPPPAATAIFTTGEGTGSYLTDIVIHTTYALNFTSVVRMTLYPPTSSGVGPIILHQGERIQGAYDELWTVVEAPLLGGLLGQQLQGDWKVTVEDLDNDAGGSPAVGQLSAFEVLYDVVRADHLVVNGRLDVDGPLHVAQDATVMGDLMRRVQYHTFAQYTQTDYSGSAWAQLAGREFTFTKKRDDTKLLIQWTENIRCRNVNGGQCEWALNIDGLACTAPAEARWGLYSAPADNNLHIPTSWTTVCSAAGGQPIAAGQHTLTGHVRSFNGALSWTGWGVSGVQPSAGSFIVEEIF